MPRSPSPHRRVELLDAVVVHLQEQGVAHFSLDSLAAPVGASKRMLLYYFGDRASLLAQALQAARPDVTAMFSDVSDPASVRAAAQALWEAIAHGPQRGSVSLLLQTLALATTNPLEYGVHAATAVSVVLGPVQAAFERAGWSAGEAATRGTLVVSGLRGLCQDLLVTGDGERVDRAAAALLEAVTA